MRPTTRSQHKAEYPVATQYTLGHLSLLITNAAIIGPMKGATIVAPAQILILRLRNVNYTVAILHSRVIR